MCTVIDRYLSIQRDGDTIMYRRPILCTLYGAVDFLNVLKKGCWVGGGGCVIGPQWNTLCAYRVVWKKYWYVMYYITYQYFYSTPPPWACIHGYLHLYFLYFSGRGRGWPANHPHPLSTSSHNTAERRPPHPSYTEQHATTLNNSTRVHKTTNVPVVFRALILNGFEGCNIITQGIGRGRSWKSQLFWAQKSLDFQGPPLPKPLVMMLQPSKPLRTAP